MGGADIEIDLHAPNWSATGMTWVRGYAHLDDQFLAAAGLAEILDACPTEEKWQQTVSRLNGCFAAVSRRGNAVLAAVDRVRSIPLFHGTKGGRRKISDSAYGIAGGSEASCTDQVAGIEFELTGYVTGAGTLVEGVSQIQAGELLRWNAESAGAPERKFYHVFAHGDYFRADAQDLIARLEIVHGNVFRRLVAGASGRTIVVPLSGGFDSRLIGVSLRDLGVRNVICYSYGLPGNWEAKISQELAKYLGFQWEFVPYSPERWLKWAASERFGAYFRAAGNLTSVPHVQDWPAVAELQRGKRIPPDSVFVPGHSGDFLAGSHIPAQFSSARMVGREQILDALYRAHYSLWEWPVEGRVALRRQFDGRVEAVVGAIGDCAAARAADLFEQWDLQERQAKFICNSVRVYEQFGYEWRLPLFDHELMDFWARVPLPLRLGRRLYMQFARERQQLPVTSANSDRNAFLRSVVRGLEFSGLKPLARRARNYYRQMHWRDAYERSSLGWLALVDQQYFRHSYTGTEIFHSYLARAYRDHEAPPAGRDVARRVIPALDLHRPHEPDRQE